MKKIVGNLYQSIVNMVNHDGIEYAGYMSFMLLVAMFPFFIFFLALTSFLGASELGKQFINLALEHMPTQSTEAIRVRINELLFAPPQSLLTLAILGTVWTSSSFVECLRTILNRVYEIKYPPNYILRRLLSVIQFLIIISAILLAMLLLVIVPITISQIPQFVLLIADDTSLIYVMRYMLIFVTLFLTVSSLYYIIPNIRLRFCDVIPGALLAVILWILSGYLLTKYIVYYNQLSIVYGSLGSIIVTLIFFYIVNIIFIVGAEFNYLMSDTSNDNMLSPTLNEQQLG